MLVSAKHVLPAVLLLILSLVTCPCELEERFCSVAN